MPQELKKLSVIPLVSIIIPTKNSEQTLLTCLESINKQTYSKIEVIIIDSHSTDGTEAIAKKFHTNIFFTALERAGAKNIALEKSHGKYACFIDSDMELTENVIQDCVSLAEENDEMGGIIIPEITVGKGFWVNVRAFERSISLHSALESARFFERKMALQVGGFDEEIIFYEESTLPQKLESRGLNVKIRSKEKILHHELSFNLSNWLKKKYYYGKSLKKYLLKYPAYPEKQISIIYRIKIYVKNGKWQLLKKFHLTCGILILKSLELIAIMFARKSK